MSGYLPEQRSPPQAHSNVQAPVDEQSSNSRADIREGSTGSTGQYTTSLKSSIEDNPWADYNPADYAEEESIDTNSEQSQGKAEAPRAKYARTFEDVGDGQYEEVGHYKETQPNGHHHEAFAGRPGTETVAGPSDIENPWTTNDVANTGPAIYEPLPTHVHHASNLNPVVLAHQSNKAAPSHKSRRPSHPAAEPKLAVEDKRKDPIVIAVFGQTGTGKSSLIKAVTGDQEIQVGHGLTSCKLPLISRLLDSLTTTAGTDQVTSSYCVVGGQEVFLVDTPGFSDTNVGDTEILRRIAEWMQDMTQADIQKLTGIIYLHRIIDPRVDGPSLKNLRMMKKLCGVSSLKNVVLATTMWEKVTEDDGARREAELRKTFWKDMIDSGSQSTRLMTNTKTEALKLVKLLLKNTPVLTRLQRELQSGKELKDTSAGAELRDEYEKITRTLKSELEATRKEFEESRLQRKTSSSISRQLHRLTLISPLQRPSNPLKRSFSSRRR